jgi:hypothetical protein
VSTMNLARSVLTALILPCLFVGVASGEPDPYGPGSGSDCATLNAAASLQRRPLVCPDAPYRVELYSSARAEQLQVRCSSLQPDGVTPRIKCEFIATSVSPKTAEDVEKDIANEAKDLRANKADFLAGCKKGKFIFPSAAPTPNTLSPAELQALTTLHQAEVKACSVGSVEPLIDAFVDLTRHAPRTCTVNVSDSWRVVFKQLDADTWQANTDPGGSCHFSRVFTLWRPAGSKYSFWNYKEVTTLPENASKECRDYSTPTTEYRGTGSPGNWPRQDWELHCDVIHFP